MCFLFGENQQQSPNVQLPHVLTGTLVFLQLCFNVSICSKHNVRIFTVSRFKQLEQRCTNTQVPVQVHRLFLGLTLSVKRSYGESFITKTH